MNRTLPLLIEVAQIRSPVETWSIAIEGENVRAAAEIDRPRSADSRGAVLAARDELRLPGSLVECGYPQMLEEWGSR